MRVVTQSPAFEHVEPGTEGLTECVACGYEPPGGHIPERCPRCFAYSTFRRTTKVGKAKLDLARNRSQGAMGPGNIIEGSADWTRDAAGAAEGSDAFDSITFEMRCHAQQTYLMFRPEHGMGKLVPLHRRDVDDDGDAWRVTIRLQAGTYRLRYYIDDGHRIVPATEDGSIDGRRCERVLVVRPKGGRRIDAGLAETAPHAMRPQALAG